MASLTSNYGWTKPVVGGDGDLWGSEINADLDSIDSTVKSVSNAIPLASSTTPAMDGTAAVGAGTTWARADHIHPTDTSRYAASNPSGYQTAAQVTAVVPVASSTAPVMDGTAAVGTGTTWARADHVHPTDTTRYAASNPSGYQTAANVTTSLAPYAPLASPAFTGTPSLPTGTTGVTQAPGDSSTKLATTAFVSALPVAMNDNRLVNGDMRIDQRNGGASGTAIGVYTVDRWKYGTATAAKGTWQRNLMTGPVPTGCGFSLQFTSSSAYASVAGDYFYFGQFIEADMVTDFNWGSALAQPVTLSFWAASSLTGTFSGAISNAANNRSYPFTYSLPTVGAWTKIAVTIPGDTIGTWPLSGNATAMSVLFDLGTGSNFRGPANAWGAANYVGATGAVSVVATNGATFNVTGVKLEVGSIATPFNRQSLAKSLADCQRYYVNVGDVAAVTTGYATSAGNWVGDVSWTAPVTMRAVPSIVASWSNFNNSNGGTITVRNDARTVNSFLTSIGAGYSSGYFTINSLNAEL